MIKTAIGILKRIQIIGIQVDSKVESKVMRLSQTKQYYDTLSDTTIDVNINSPDILAFSKNPNNSKDNSNKKNYPSSHTNSITSNLNRKLISKLQHNNNNKVARNNKIN